MKKVFCVFIFMTALCAIAFIVLSCKKKDASEDAYVFKINLAIGYVCQAPLYIAASQGYFEEEGLKWDRIDGDETLNLITSGQTDAAFALMVGLVQPLANGLPVKIPLAVHTGCIKVLVRGDSEIKTAADLKGKKIAGDSPAGATIIFTNRVLADLGFKVDGENADFEYVYQSNSDLPLLLERGVVDAIAIADPIAQIAQDENGFRAIIDNAVDEKYKDEFCCIVIVNSETVKNYPQATAKYLRAIQRGAKFVQENPDETARILVSSEYLSLDPQLIAKILKTYRWEASVSQALLSLERNAKDARALGILESDIDVDKLVNDVFAEVPGVPDSLF